MEYSNDSISTLLPTERNRSDKISKIAIALLFCFLLGAMLILISIGKNTIGFEDVSMLFRYAGNLANGYGIVWNIGESPVDGCTDFSLVLILALLIKLGLSGEVAMLLVSSVSHFATAVVVYNGAKLTYMNNRIPALVSSALIIFGPGLLYVSALWGTPFFAFWISLAWLYALKLAVGDGSRKTSFLFSLFGLLSGMARPEGVFLSTFMLLSLIYLVGFRNMANTIILFIATFGIIGIGYLAWRWNYFGYPFPNAFYRKGNDFYISGLFNGIKNTLFFSIPVIPLLAVGAANKSYRRWLIFTIIPMVLFCLLWATISPEMNFIGRFQYALFPMLLMSSPRFIEALNFNKIKMLFSRRSIRCLISCILIVVIAVLAAPLGNLMATRYMGRVFSQDGRRDLGLLLNKYASRGYTMAVSEAGHLPYYSRWKAIDAWGLNDKWIAHHKLITEDYLDNYKPQLIMFAADYPFNAQLKLNNPESLDKRTKNWLRMITTLKDYAEKHDYFLAAIYSPDSSAAHYYYVNRNFDGSHDIINEIRQVEYHWIANPHKCWNLVRADQQP